MSLRFLPRLTLVGCIGLLIVTALPLRGQVTITFTAVPEINLEGYAAGQTYTFALTTTANFSDFSHSYFRSDLASWGEGSSQQTALWGQIGGTALLGTYQRPSSVGVATFLDVFTGSGGVVAVAAMSSAAPGSDLGLRTLAGTPIVTLSPLILTVEMGPVALSPTPMTPDALLLPVTGNYHANADTQSNSMYLETSSGAVIWFAVQSVSIAAAASQSIPEPSSAALLLLGLAAVGALCAYSLRRYP